jgi:ornithine cyclodeaminase/alanine dehydrogenase-like protein (mu-crystallin family)
VTTGPARGLPFLDAAALRGAVPMADAIDALEAALRDGSAPGNTPPRSVVPISAGQVLSMPAEMGPSVGVKLVTVAPRNAERGLPRIQGVYVLFDGATLTPVALIDAVALTSLRTPAVSALALRHLAPPRGPSDRAVRLVVFGTGPQGVEHVEAVAAVRPLASVTMVGRDTGRTRAAVEACSAAGFPAEAVVAGSEAVGPRLATADVVVCATTAREPLFDSGLLAAEAVVIAVGSHEPDAREVDSALVGRATVVVESPDAAPREAGDLVIPRAEGLENALPAGDLAGLVSGRVRVAPGAPRLFKSVGEAWEDLVVAALAVQRIGAPA